MKKAVDNKKVFGALITDPSKALDCISDKMFLTNVTCTRTAIFNFKIDARLSPNLKTNN